VFEKVRNAEGTGLPDNDKLFGLQFIGKLSVQRIFLFFSVTWGVLTVFLTPPFQVPDENVHFFRIYHISTGHFVAGINHNQIGGFIPESVLRLDSVFSKIRFKPGRKVSREDWLHAINIPLNPERQSFANFQFVAHYSPVPYLPQTLGLMLPRLLQLRPLFLLYAARLGNLFIWTILIYLAIGITPLSGWMFLLVALLPMSVFQGASVSGDAMANGLAFLLTALIFRLAFDDKKSIGRRDILQVILVAGLLALCKNAYFFLILPVVLIPAWKFRSGKKRLLTVMGILSVVAVAVIAGSLYMRYVYRDFDMSAGMYASIPRAPRNIFPYKQLDFILTHQGVYLKTIVSELWEKKRLISESFIGRLGWLDTPLPGLYIIFAWVMLLFVSLTGPGEINTITPVQRGLLFITLCSVVMVMCTLLYMSWNPVGSPKIKGINQGRYFIAIAPLALSLFFNRHFKLQKKVIQVTCLLFIAVSVVVMTSSMISRYYLE